MEDKRTRTLRKPSSCGTMAVTRHVTSDGGDRLVIQVGNSKVEFEGDKYMVKLSELLRMVKEIMDHTCTV